MPSKNRRAKSNKIHNEFHPFCYREFGVTTNKYKILQKIVKLSNTVYLIKKIINEIRNIYPNQDLRVSRIIQKFTIKIKHLEKNIDQMKNQTRGCSFDSVCFDSIYNDMFTQMSCLHQLVRDG
ncbi:hypothetical protein [Powai lake megavirus]|uniref:Uncharacterized protein n=1 Tax=Powai lake megavirus TaxID=1842663 RepID=A0A160ER22_9VIRU|nr:hypothetical protein QJ849_gp957 [Powai lake megavirus]ANB51119.1 hypothetical protein [Powai lake megavirus]